MLPSSIVLSQHSRPDQPVCALSPFQPVDVLESFEAIPVGASGCVWVLLSESYHPAEGSSTD